MGRIDRTTSMKLFTPRHRRIANQGSQRSTEASSTQRRKNERKALNLNAYGKLDKAQEYGETGDVIPIVFCQRVGNYGGAWIAPVLVDTASDQFNQTFIYLVSSGQITLPAGKRNYLFGKTTLKGVEEYAATTLTLTSHYTSDDTVCPISGFATGCVHNTFKFLIEALTPEVGKRSASNCRRICNCNHCSRHPGISRQFSPTNKPGTVHDHSQAVEQRYRQFQHRWYVYNSSHRCNASCIH